ncbi:sperm acrosome membrane-associated protein 4 [Maylandia zebra]|uniref:Lymphocyte antigen-6, epidermis n=1 Tax=Maylandia zebra TaxID=106582 RepID=A0A3P9DKU5_9CICH|nr:prostate stem cell antigen [Maylandia zebra]
MNRVILQLFAVGLCFAIAQALVCYQCAIGIGSLCVTSEKTCASGELCYSGVGKAIGFVDIKMKGCLAVAKCNKTEDVDFGTNRTVYKMTKTCCNTNLCNAAPGTPTLTLALATISAVFVGNLLV